LYNQKEKNSLQNWCEIFKVGCFKDSNGIKHNFSIDDLNKIVFNFKGKNPDVPICIGHSKTNSPAYGWVDALKIKDNKLYACYKQVQNEFKEAVKKGLFKTRSISLTPDLILRHIAFLGAQAPAIKGMEEFCFHSAAGDEAMSFDSEIYITDFQENERTNMENEEKLKQTNEELEKVQKENADLKAQILQQQQEAQSKDFEDFCDKAIEKGNILPAQKDSVINILSACSNTNFEFADDTGKTPVQEFKEFVSSLKQMDFEEIANKKKLQIDEAIDFSDSQTILEAIQKTQADYKSRGVEINPATALDIVKKGNN